MSGRERFLVVGADGLIGHSLVENLLREGREVFGTTRRTDNPSPQRLPLDLGGEIAGWQPPAQINAAFLCAAVTNQETCRGNPAAALKVNVSGTVTVAEKLIKTGASVVFLSTNLVFDGATACVKPTDATNPKTEYGRQKRLAEEALLKSGGTVCVLRLSKVLHPQMPLLSKWASALRAAQPIYPLTDLRCSPVPLSFAVEAVCKAGLARLSGIFHVSGAEDVSYADIARHLAKMLNVNEQLVCPRTSMELGLQLEHLPEHTTLDCSSLVSALNSKLPDVHATLDSVIADLIAL